MMLITPVLILFSRVASSLATSPSCAVSPSAPSVAPSRVGSPDASSPDGIYETSPNVSITGFSSTLFEYSMPRDFAPPGSLCALEFRLPVCSLLPKGYPCFFWTGMEQQVLSNSGMNFALKRDDGFMKTWNDTALQQVWPGNHTIYGTFDCGTAPSYGGERTIIWHATSVEDFGLRYLQAGIGPNAKYKDGVGAWIVLCS